MSSKKEVKEADVKDAAEQKDYAAIEIRLKKQFGEVTKIEFSVKGQKLIAYLREPSLAELDGTLATLQSAPISSSVGLFKTVYVGGDDEILTLASKSGVAIAINKEIQRIIPLVHSTSQTL